jgi:hypothetical protein
MLSNQSGEALRNAGTALADSQSKAKSIIMRLAILDLAIKGEPFTADDLPDDDKQRSNRTGSSFLALSRKGLIVFTGQCGRSVRPCRHAGFSRIWQAPDVSRCHAEAIRLLGELQLLEPVPKQGGLFGTERGA